MAVSSSQYLCAFDEETVLFGNTTGVQYRASHKMKRNIKFSTVDKNMNRKVISERSIVSAVTVLFLFFKIIGLATFSLRIDTTKHKDQKLSLSFVHSRAGIFYNLFLIVFTFIVNSISVPYRVNHWDDKNSAMTTSLGIFHVTLAISVTCVIFFSYCIYGNTLINVGNRLVNIERTLHQLAQPIRRIQIFWNLLSTCLLYTVLSIILYAAQLFTYGGSPIALLSDVLPTIFVGCYFVQYSCLVSLILAHFTDVHQRMQNLARSSYVDVRDVSLYQTYRVFITGSSMKTLRQLKNIHEWLCEISNEISEFYSMPILLSIAFNFYALVYNGHYYVVSMALKNHMTKCVAMGTCLMWFSVLLYPIFLLTSRVTKINSELQKTGNIVHTLMSCAVGRESKAELKDLSLQLLHRDVNFTACGFFVLDNTLFHSIISASTTYLVILIQFDMAKDSSTNMPRNCT